MGEEMIVVIECWVEGDKHFQSKAKVEGNVDVYIKHFMKIQDKCHICDAKLVVMKK